MLTHPYVWLFGEAPSLLITHLTFQCLIQRRGPEQKHRGNKYKQKGLSCFVCDHLYVMIIKLKLYHFRKWDANWNKEKLAPKKSSLISFQYSVQILWGFFKCNAYIALMQFCIVLKWKTMSCIFPKFINIIFNISILFHYVSLAQFV